MHKGFPPSFGRGMENHPVGSENYRKMRKGERGGKGKKGERRKKERDLKNFNLLEILGACA